MKTTFEEKRRGEGEKKQTRRKRISVYDITRRKLASKPVLKTDFYDAQ